MRKAGSVVCCIIFSLHVYSQDCTLTAYLDKGVANSPVLKDLSNQIISNRYDSLIARATYLPQVSFNGSAMYAPTVNGWGYSEVITNGSNLAGTLNISQQIFNRKTKEADFERYGLESGSLANTRQISTGELKKAITSQYLAAYAALEDRNFKQEILQTLEREAVVLKAWTENGIYRQTDYLAMQFEIMTLEQDIRDLDLQYRKESWNLNLICGIGDTAACELTLPVIRDTTAGTMAGSPFFRQFVFDSLLIRNEQFLLEQRYKPAVGWFADGGVVNNEPRYLYQNFGVSAGMSISLPVFDWNQRKINAGRIRMCEETRKNYLENFRFRYHAQMKTLQAELDQTRRSITDNEKQVSLAQELIAADRVLLNSGSLQITDYILAVKNLIEARHAGLRYRIRIQYILNEINFLKQ